MSSLGFKCEEWVEIFATISNKTNGSKDGYPVPVYSILADVIGDYSLKVFANS